MPVLPSSGEVPAYGQRELNSENELPIPVPSLDNPNGILKANDFQRKVRDLELQLIDQKAQTERTFTAMRESLFSKLERDLSNIASKQEQQDRVNNQNFQVAAEQFQSHRRYTGDQFTNLTDQVAVLQA